MKIESSTSNAFAQLQSGAARASGGSASQSAVDAVQNAGNATDSGSTTVNLSTQQLGHGSDIDMAKVESIKAALRDGTYTIDAGKIADGMLGNARDLLQTRTGTSAASA